MRDYLLIVLFLLTTGLLHSQDAREIVRKADEKARGKTSVATMDITTVRPKWTRTMEIKAWMKGNDYAMLLVKSPAKDKGTAYLKRKKEVWNWLPSLERTIKLPPSMMSQSWMGTDFTNDDLVKESSVLDDYEHTLLATEKQGDSLCYKIQMIPKPEAAVVWGKVIVWITPREYLQLRAEFFDESGELVNTMTGSQVKKLGGRLLPTRLEMTPADKKGHQTVIEYKSLEFDKPIADSFFTTGNMTKVR